MKRIKTKLHSLLFPDQVKRTENLEKLYHHWKEAYDRKSTRVYSLEEKLDKKNKEPPKREPTIADLMRDTLGLEQVNFYDVEQSTDPATTALPKHFLNTDSKEKRAMYIAQLAQIQELEVWEVMCRYHIDYQGNYSFRKALTDMEVFSGRLSVNGISLLRNDVRKGHDEYVEGRKPKEDFDEFETTEGVPFKNDNQ